MVGTVLAIVSSPIFGQKDTIFQALTDLICYVAPPITAVFLFGVFWKRATGKAAYLAMVVGNVIGIAIFFLEMFKDYTGWDRVVAWHQGATGMATQLDDRLLLSLRALRGDHRGRVATSSPSRSRKRPSRWCGRTGASRCGARPTGTAWATTASSRPSCALRSWCSTSYFGNLKEKETIMPRLLLALSLSVLLAAGNLAASAAEPVDMNKRTKELKDLKWGMFICWSFSTFSGKEWTPGVKDVAFFKATGCDTDQWARTAKEAGMGYILFLTKHHDGFCLWDTKTTDRKVTKSPAGQGRAGRTAEVVRQARHQAGPVLLRRRLDLARRRGRRRAARAAANPGDEEGPTQGTAHAVRPDRVHLVRPCRGRRRPEPQGDRSPGASRSSRAASSASTTATSKGPTSAWARWAGRDRLDDPKPRRARTRGTRPSKATCWPSSPIRSSRRTRAAPCGSTRCPSTTASACRPKKLYEDYLGAVKYGNIFSLDVGPDYNGRLRKIDVETLRTVGEMIRNPPAAGK